MLLVRLMFLSLPPISDEQNGSHRPTLDYKDCRYELSHLIDEAKTTQQYANDVRPNKLVRDPDASLASPIRTVQQPRVSDSNDE